MSVTVFYCWSVFCIISVGSNLRYPNLNTIRYCTQFESKSHDFEINEVADFESPY